MVTTQGCHGYLPHLLAAPTKPDEIGHEFKQCWAAIAMASHIQEGEDWNTSASHLMHTKETEVNSGNVYLLQATLNNFPTFSYDFNYPNTCDVI